MAKRKAFMQALIKKLGWKFFVLSALALLVFLWLIRTPILNSYLTEKIGVKVSLEWVGIWPTHTNIYRFKVHNPPGFKGDAFKAETIECQYQLHQLFSDPTIIDQIEIRNSVLRIDLKNGASSPNNWTAIAHRMPKSKKGGHVIIKKLILTNLNVDVHGASFFTGPNQTHFDRLEFDNIDSAQGFPTAALIQMIFQGSGMGEFIEELFSPNGIFFPLKLFGI